jgi:hypothetical protein
LALGDSYATAADYRARAGKTDTGDSTMLEAQLKAVSHYIDSRCRRRDGFNQSGSAEVRTYDIRCLPGPGVAFLADYYRRVWLPDDVATLTGLIVKVDLNGDYDVTDSNETLTINTDFWAGPSNAAVGADPKPFEFLDLHPNSTKANTWPEQRRALEVTAKFGWPEVPEAVKELTIAITRQLRDLQVSGASVALQNMDTVITGSRELTMLMLNIERQYRRGPSF